MKQLNFVKEAVNDELLSSIKSVEDAKLLLADLSGQENHSSGIIYNILNRKDYIKEIFNALNSRNQKLIMIGGFQGTGKTELIKTISAFLDENILHFYYECSAITNLDDIILSLYSYLQRIPGNNQGLTRSAAQNQSIDERLINILKNLKKPLLFVIDSFECLIGENGKVLDDEVLHLLNFVLSLPLIKLAISGKKLPSGLQINNENVLKIKLSGLDEAEFLRILNDKNIVGSSQMLYQIFQGRKRLS